MGGEYPFAAADAANLEARAQEAAFATLALFTLSHVLAAIARNFAVLVIARLGIAISHAIFWSITSSLVVRVAPINKGSQAIGMLALGTSLRWF